MYAKIFSESHSFHLLAGKSQWFSKSVLFFPKYICRLCVFEVNKRYCSTGFRYLTESREIELLVYRNI